MDCLFSSFHPWIIYKYQIKLFWVLRINIKKWQYTISLVWLRVVTFGARELLRDDIKQRGTILVLGWGTQGAFMASEMEGWRHCRAKSPILRGVVIRHFRQVSLLVDRSHSARWFSAKTKDPWLNGAGVCGWPCNPTGQSFCMVWGRRLSCLECWLNPGYSRIVRTVLWGGISSASPRSKQANQVRGHLGWEVGYICGQVFESYHRWCQPSWLRKSFQVVTFLNKVQAHG